MAVERQLSAVFQGDLDQNAQNHVLKERVAH